MSQTKRIAIYGGTFDPVHDGHLAVARSLVELLALDCLMFVPAHTAPHKRSAPPTSPWHRHAMLALATQGEERFRVSSVELEAPERPYSVDTVARLREEFHGARLFFVMGADSWAEITTWREWERLLEMCDHVVVTRPGYELSFEHVPVKIRARVVDLRGSAGGRAPRAVAEGEPPKIFLSDAVSEDVSATEVRRGVARGENLDGLRVPRAVADYINKYGLYRDQA
ncbi:MAG: nicotinate-nucleotide adenylyltransferase [Acidobacteria bacterium]|nr:nicotinate-nucleotide adenylyltransferase [Acidobacteriota bacterium]MCA1641268.1 nicotinate-nucleotide adenylyltransferase [Acidobacteriota bacterium]